MSLKILTLCINVNVTFCSNTQYKFSTVQKLCVRVFTVKEFVWNLEVRILLLFSFKWGMYRVVQNYWYCEGKYGCGVCLTPPKSYMSFFFHKNNIFQHFTSRKFPKYCAKFWKIMSVNWIILHPYFRNDNFSKDRNYSFLIEILFTKLS